MRCTDSDRYCSCCRRYFQVWLLEAYSQNRRSRVFLFRRQLKLKEPIKKFKTCVFRSNLFYEIIFKDYIEEDPFDNLKKFIEKCLEMHPTSEKLNNSSCGIVYCRTRDACCLVAGRLIAKNISAKAYHAGLKSAERDQVQEDWMEGR
jgi:ATP-dependent DNA helicase Q5